MTDAVVKRGRPRNQATRAKILRAALLLAQKADLQRVSIEAIAEKAKVGKTTIYRWWPSKSAVIMEAFLEQVAPGIKYEKTDDPMNDVLLQMKRLYRTYSKPPGRTFLHLLAQSQFDDELSGELSKYVRERRVAAKSALERAVLIGFLKPEIDLEIVLDQLYAPIFYRLIAGYGEVDDEFIDKLFSQVLDGITGSRIWSS